jgi:hypothetical protein
MLPKHVSYGNISGTHVPKRTLHSSVPIFIQLQRFEKTHFESIGFGAENLTF